MDQWKLWLVHLLPLCFCFDNEVTFVTTTGRDPYVARLCTIDSWRKGTLIRCKISRERRRGDDCFVAYPPGGEDLFTICESRFTLMMVNQTVFLHLTGLTPADSGNYTCVCPFPDGKDILRLNITVEDTIRGQEHLSVKPPSLWTKMTQMTSMTPTQASSSQPMISTRPSPRSTVNTTTRGIQPATA
ncbi:uncharacterized protein LOC120554124 isoform X2 [Perca fluviatilis]|uniref:uncharacterized protein LOC120554124 isoform X2 n=1 Tax=Perca fluviatilis TaxID=8168 RepID=UPI0019665865|nr:uncharacterized protein LOC120554124 isoform X2 [Perca fluviatilis]